MGDLINLLGGIVEFPSRGAGIAFIGKFVYILIKGLGGGGAVNYGVAIIFFTIILKLILLPLDFINRFFTKRNSNMMTKIKPEEDELREQFGSDMLQFNRARQAIYKKHGYKMSGFCLFSIVNMVVTLMIFISVFSSLRAVATHNVRLQVQDLQAVHQVYTFDTATADTLAFEKALAKKDAGMSFEQAINVTYNERSIGFLWIKNIWRQDVPWANSALSEGEYVSNSNREVNQMKIDHFKDLLIQEFHDNRDSELSDSEFDELLAEFELTLEQQTDAQYMTAIVRFEYRTIYKELDSSHKRKWNGLLILVILAGVSSWGSAYITAKMTKAKNQNKKTKEQIVQYSMRKAKTQTDNPIPQVDPAAVGKIMMFVLPAIMVFFTMSSTAALAIYIITNSLISTGITFGLNWPVDKLLAWEEKRRAERGDLPDTDTDVINPHAKYFKRRKKS